MKLKYTPYQNHEVDKEVEEFNKYLESSKPIEVKDEKDNYQSALKHMKWLKNLKKD